MKSFVALDITISQLPYDIRPRWIVVSNFTEIHIHDMNTPHAEPEIIKLENLEKEFYRLSFLTEQKNIHIKREMEVSIKAGEIVGQIYDKLLEQYKTAKNLDMEKCLKSLNILCVRLVFCLYAEDAGIFGHKSMFGDYLNHFEAKDLRNALLNLFKVLDQKPEDRDPFLEEELAAFPYVNGGLFTEEDQFIPPFTDELKELLIQKASDDFDWSEISPTIFGAVFESTLNPETRRTGGMHYTSIENIHKVIDPLFMDELNEEFEAIKELKQEKTKETKLIDFQEKLGSLKFLDPACGSGNFLTETYLSIRRLENEVISILNKGEKVLGFDDFIKVKINQFYGIEINDFAVVVAKTALWIAENQMMMETEKIIGINLDFLPLTTNAFIVEGNALRMNWETLKPIDENMQLNDGLFAGFATEVDGNEIKYDYIMGNPPFVGRRYRSAEQQNEIAQFFSYKDIDYVACWYKKAAQLIKNTSIKCAFVSTNSITQGEQVQALWKDLFEQEKIEIDFAYRTFRWDSESTQKAHVHCVIVGFSVAENTADKRLYDNSIEKAVKNINAYLVEAPNVFIESRSKSICDVPPMIYGNKPTDGGHLFLTVEECEIAISKEPHIEKYIKQIYGATEYINNKKRYCLWLVGANPNELRKSSFIMNRVEQVRKFRTESTKEATQRSAETPTLFQEIRHPSTEYIIIPRHSSENRKYIPFGFVSPEIIVNDAVQIIPEATLYHFGILMSNVHMAWMRAVAGRLKSDYRYSKDIVYNNFPWCNPTDEQKAKIEQTAQAILDARAKYPDCSLADLYDELTMPPELRKAHQENDRAVMQAYGFSKDTTESEIVAELFKMYERLVKLLKA